MTNEVKPITKEKTVIEERTVKDRIKSISYICPVCQVDLGTYPKTKPLPKYEREHLAQPLDSRLFLPGTIFWNPQATFYIPRNFIDGPVYSGTYDFFAHHFYLICKGHPKKKITEEHATLQNVLEFTYSGDKIDFDNEDSESYKRYKQGNLGSPDKLELMEYGAYSHNVLLGLLASAEIKRITERELQEKLPTLIKTLSSLRRRNINFERGEGVDRYILGDEWRERNRCSEKNIVNFCQV